MKKITRLHTKAIWQRLWEWVRYQPILTVKDVKQPADKLKHTISSWGSDGWWCVDVFRYSERDGKGNHIDMVHVMFQKEVHIGIHKLKGGLTDKDKEELIHK